MLKAELSGDDAAEAKLRGELEAARAEVAAYVAAVEDNKGAVLDPHALGGFSGSVLCDPRYPRVLDPCPEIICESKRHSHP